MSDGATAAAAAAADDSSVGYFQYVIDNPLEFPLTFVYAFVALLAFDVLFARQLYDVVKKPSEATRKKRPQKSRWFAIHVFANLIVCIAAFKPVVTAMIDPAHSADGTKYSDTSIFGTGTNFPLVMIIAVHVYHMVIFDDLSSADYFHHLMFIPTMGIPGMLYKWGPAQSFLCFFISGLPGGIDYAALALNKMGWINDRSLIKKIGALQNSWIRWPGIIVSAYNIYMGWVYGSLHAPWYWALLIAGLSSFNAIYYGFQAISAQTKDSIVQQHLKEGDTMFENGGRGIKVNRPGS